MWCSSGRLGGLRRNVHLCRRLCRSGCRRGRDGRAGWQSGMAGRDGGVGRRGRDRDAGCAGDLCERSQEMFAGFRRAGMPAPGTTRIRSSMGFRKAGLPRGEGSGKKREGSGEVGRGLLGRALGNTAPLACPPGLCPMWPRGVFPKPYAPRSRPAPDAGPARSDRGPRWVQGGPARSGAVRRGTTAGATRVRHGCDTGATQFGAVQRAGAVRRGCDAVRRWSDVGATRSGARCDLGRHLDVGRPRHRWRRFQGAGAMVSRPERRRERCVR
jgi:hypothetical protein